MTLQDQIESFQKLIFAHFRGSNNNECRISALVPLVKESFGIYKFITSMMRAMHRRESRYHTLLTTGTDAMDALLPLSERYNAQHYNLRKFYYECSNLKYLTGLINVPKLGQVCGDKEAIDFRNRQIFWTTGLLLNCPKGQRLTHARRRFPRRHPVRPHRLQRRGRLRNNVVCSRSTKESSKLW
jgi:hypothetical protein